MSYSPRHILSAIALLLAIVSLFAPHYPLVTVAVVLLSIAQFLP